MPVHIDEMSSEVTMFDGELPLTPAQIDKLVRLVMSRIADQHRAEESRRAATELRRHSTAPFEVGS
jgi:hypothetical protein